MKEKNRENKFVLLFYIYTLNIFKFGMPTKKRFEKQVNLHQTGIGPTVYGRYLHAHTELKNHNLL
jgi:hypothetical protein